MKLLFACVLVCLSFSLYGQDSVILTGHVNDQQKSPIAYADIIIKSLLDSQIVQISYIDSGQFKMDPLPPGDYTFEIHCLGYQTYVETMTLASDQRLDIELVEDTQMLDQVTVTATRNPIKYEGGNLKVQVTNTILEGQSSVMSLFGLLPSVQVGVDGESLQIIGRGSPLIYMGNQRISMQQLLSLSVDEIGEVEIINNPSAKYEAQGRSVIIIHRKMNAADGYDIQLTENASWKRRFNNYLRSNIRWKSGAMEWRGNLAYNRLTHWESLATNYDLVPQDINTSSASLATGRRPQYVAGVGFYYGLKGEGYISADINARLQSDSFPILNENIVHSGVDKDVFNTRSLNKENRDFISGNVNYFRPLGSRSKLFMGSQYSYYIRDLKSDINTKLNDGPLQLIQMRDQVFTIDAVAFRLDYEQQFGNDVVWESGANYYLAWADALADFDFIEASRQVSTDYDYRERNVALYSQMKGGSEKFTYEVGLRMETNRALGQFVDEDERVVDRSLLNIFPRLTGSYNFAEDRSLTVNYGTTIQRPNYLNASSISTFLSPVIEFSRNPNLQASIREEASAFLQVRTQSVGVTLSIVQNPVFFSVRYDEPSDRLIASPENFKEQRSINLQWNGSLSHKFWNGTYTFLGTINDIRFPNGVSGDVKPYLYFSTNHRFTISGASSLNLNFWTLTKRFEGVYERNALAVLGASYSHEITKRLRLQLVANDLFRQMNFEDHYDINGIRTQQTFFADGQEFAISISYRFGREVESTYKNKEVDEQVGRIR